MRIVPVEVLQNRSPKLTIIQVLYKYFLQEKKKQTN